ncbi:MAG TPA: hypothetical protein VN643_12255 [Pyrinomonadaceae bacterium]|nr:hypothetical protein [Pyrinomonadaceae bacterium]
MLLLILERHFLYSRQNGRDTLMYYYYDAYTWIAAALVLAWVTWLIARRVLRNRRMRRPSRNNNRRELKGIVKIKRQLSSTYLRPGMRGNIHAVGVGRLDDGRYCVQVFISDRNFELWPGAGGTTLPNTYRGVPLILVEMPLAGLLSSSPAEVDQQISDLANNPVEGIRGVEEVIVGGISGANTNLFGESGTIGYFCTRKSAFRRQKEIHLLSNAHVFADLRKANLDDTDLIMQPSPGEAASNRPIGSLVNFFPLKFETGINDPNYVDGAVAKLWRPQPHKPVIPSIGSIKGHVVKKDVEIGEEVRKFGRTTGYTEGQIYSIYLDIWIGYARTGKAAYFQDQLLVQPSQPDRFVAKGDSGSLLVDANQYAVGLIFAGMAGEAAQNADGLRIEGYGVANPISEVLDRLKIDLVV